MPCCSVYDVQNLVTPLAATTKGAAKAGAQRAYDCRNDGCYNELNGGDACPKGKCLRDEHGKPDKEHPRPRCANHDRPRPLGRGTTKKVRGVKKKVRAVKKKVRATTKKRR